MRFLLFFLFSATAFANPVFNLQGSWMVKEQHEKVQNRIIDFWFGENADPVKIEPHIVKRWFMKDPGFDQEIKEKFSNEVHRASSGRYDTWEETPRGRLALILLLDQFKRNIYRGSPKAWESDEKGQEIALEGIRLRDDAKLPPSHRAFFYMPLEHAESRNLQVLSVGCFSDLVQEVPPEDRGIYKQFLDYAKKHKAIIDRFGRYPHRNAVLGRMSTSQEIEFLQQPDSSF